MNEFWDVIWVMLLAADLVLAGSSRLFHCIKVVALQGILLGILAWISHGIAEDGFSWGVLLTSGVNVAVKGWLLPWLLIRAVRQAGIRRELEPFVGFSASLMIVLGIAALFLGICRISDWEIGTESFLALPVSLTTMVTGLFLIVARRKAITQALGFLIFENGITAFGIGMGIESGLVVELGILLDVLVLVFVMGITLFHINREFEHLDADKLTDLGDRVEPEMEVQK